MINHCLKPGEICEAVIGSCEKKGKLSIIKMILLGLLAGVFIGFGAHAAIIIMQIYLNILLFSLKYLYKKNNRAQIYKVLKVLP